MAPFGVVPALYPLEDRVGKLGAGSPGTGIEDLELGRCSLRPFSAPQRILAQPAAPDLLQKKWSIRTAVRRGGLLGSPTRSLSVGPGLNGLNAGETVLARRVSPPGLRIVRGFRPLIRVG
jgi:hypothetical protein